jgi:hypothetical protein
VSYFDPKSKTYKSKETPSFSLRVSPGEEKSKYVPSGTDQGSLKKEVLVVGQDLMPIMHQRAILENQSLKNSEILCYLLFWPLTMILYLVTRAWKLRRDLRRGDVDYQRKDGACKIFKNELAKISLEDNHCFQIIKGTQRLFIE